MKDIRQSAVIQAEKELKEERFRKDVEKAKERLRLKKSIWQKLFPYKLKLKIERY